MMAVKHFLWEVERVRGSTLLFFYQSLERLEDLTSVSFINLYRLVDFKIYLI